MFYQTIAVICFWWLTTCRETLNTLFLLWLPTANRLFVSLFTYFQFLVFVLCFLCWTFHWSSSGYSFLRLFWYTSTLCYCYFKLGHTPSLWFFLYFDYTPSAMKGWWSIVITPLCGRAAWTPTFVNAIAQEESDVGALNWYHRYIYKKILEEFESHWSRPQGQRPSVQVNVLLFLMSLCFFMETLYIIHENHSLLVIDLFIFFFLNKSCWFMSFRSCDYIWHISAATQVKR